MVIQSATDESSVRKIQAFGALVNITGAVRGKKLRWIKKKIRCVLKGNNPLLFAVFAEFPFPPWTGTRVVFAIAGAGWTLAIQQLPSSVGT